MNNLATGIIRQNQYMTLASVDKQGTAWASPVAYVFDDKFNFYWVSVPNSQHQQNIAFNPNISIAIFDSHQLWGEGVGVQMEAVVEQVPITDIPHVTMLYFSRGYPYGNALGAFGKGLKELLKGKIYLFYKATPTKVWVPDPNAEVDTRIEVSLI
jgi:uncharacterized protein YhbP (UPF0306 family)